MAVPEIYSKYTFRLAEGLRASEIFQESFSNLSLQMPTAFKTSEKMKYSEKSEKELEDMLEEVKTAYSASWEKVEKMKEEFEKLKKEADERITQEKFLSRRATDLKMECTELRRSKVSSKDESFKEIIQKRYKALRNMVQVRFDFGKEDENTLSGFAFNHTTNKVKHFNITNLSTMNEDEICAHIKACMKEVSSSNYKDIALE